MTRHKSFKQLVRSRMTKTGESYTAARAVLLAAQPSTDSPKPPLATSDASIRARTGRGWEEWFDLLDRYGAAERTHREVARWVADQLGIEPLVWEAQAVTLSYERARGPRAVGEHADGFAIPRRGLSTWLPNGSSMRSSTRRSAGSGCRTGSCANAPPPGRDRHERLGQR